MSYGFFILLNAKLILATQAIDSKRYKKHKVNRKRRQTNQIVVRQKQKQRKRVSGAKHLKHQSNKEWTEQRNLSKRTEENLPAKKSHLRA